MRVASVLAELAGTWAAPILMRKIGPVRAGLWLMMWQISCIAAFAGTTMKYDAGTRIVGICLIVGITFKRLRLWGSDLCIQYIVQEGRTSAGP
jgi:solute carrier family 40 (iron-regulated transporter), member 1